MRDLDLEWLRAFVAVVDDGGFTRAAERLHRTQSTISQQLKRLESQVGAVLLDRSTRHVAVTERGELLLGYARRLLSLNEEALVALEETRLQGRIRLGSAQEVADGGLANLLAHFSRVHPGVALEVRVDAMLRLREEVARGELDLAIIFQELGSHEDPGVSCQVIERLGRVWVASPDLVIDPEQPVPLVLSNAPCIFRHAVLSSLDAIGRPWRIVLSTPSLSGMRAALRAGLGVGVRTQRWLESDLRVITEGFPPLADVELVLLTAAKTDEVVVERLQAALGSALSA